MVGSLTVCVVEPVNICRLVLDIVSVVVPAAVAVVVKPFTATCAAEPLAAVRTERPVAVESEISVEFIVAEREPLETTQTY